LANILTALSGWSVTEASNQPDSTDSATITGDLRAIQAGIRYVYSQDTIASAATTDLGSKDSGSLTISGTTTITALGTVSAGIRKSVVFSGILTLTHNATSLILPSTANITTAANDRAEFESLGGGNWRCNWYTRANGTSVTSDLADGDKGDITVSASGATWTIDNDVIDAATLADSALGVTMINGIITASVAANALTVAIKTKAGTDPSASDPVLIAMRSGTLTSGEYNVRSVTAATSLVITSGSTLGTTSGVASKLDVLAIDNAGTIELAITNNIGSLVLDEIGAISTTAEGGAGGADSANTVYSSTARSNVAYKIIGRVTSTQAAAGTWATSPSNVSIAPNEYTNPEEIKPALNAAGFAPVYAPRAWVNFNGSGVVAIRASGNVSSVTDNGTGDYTINFTTDIQDANYAGVFSCGPSTSANGDSVNNNSATAQTTTSCRIIAVRNGVGAFDFSQINASFFR
jgi:hypothetical protein